MRFCVTLICVTALVITAVIQTAKTTRLAMRMQEREQIRLHELARHMHSHRPRDPFAMPSPRPWKKL